MSFQNNIIYDHLWSTLTSDHQTPKLWASSSCRVEFLRQFASKSVRSFSKYRVTHEKTYERSGINVMFLDRIGTKISTIYINDIYHDSIMIFSSETIMIFLIFVIYLIFSKYQHLLLLFTYFSNSCVSKITQTVQVPRWCNNIAEKFNPLGRAQQRHRCRHRRTVHAIRRT